VTGRVLTTIVLVIYFCLLAPLIVVVATSFSASSGFDFPPHGLSLRWYRAFLESEAYVKSFFKVSLVLALLVAVFSTALGMLAAIGLVRFRYPGREFVETFFLLPLVTPEIILGATLYLYYSRLGLTASIWTLLLAHLVIATPYVIRCVTAGLAGIDLRLEEAARSLGATPVQAFVRVSLPLLRSSLLSGAVIAFIISFSDINLALFLTGPDVTPLPVHIFAQIHWEADPTIAAAATLQIAIIGCLILLVQRIVRLRQIV
jgi:putative spermidine/putrescine transport system permease protein